MSSHHCWRYCYNPIVQTPKIMQLNLSHHFSSTFLLGWASASTCRNRHPYLKLRHTGGCQKLHEGFVHFFHLRNFGTESLLVFQKGSLVCYLNFTRVSFRQSVPSLLVQARTIVLHVSVRICFQTRDHDGNYVSLLPNIVQLLSTDCMIPPSFPRWLFSLLLVTAPLSTISFRALKFRVFVV